MKTMSTTLILLSVLASGPLTMEAAPPSPDAKTGTIASGVLEVPAHPESVAGLRECKDAATKYNGWLKSITAENKEVTKRRILQDLEGDVEKWQRISKDGGDKIPVPDSTRAARANIKWAAKLKTYISKL